MVFARGVVWFGGMLFCFGRMSLTFNGALFSSAKTLSTRQDVAFIESKNGCPYFEETTVFSSACQHFLISFEDAVQIKGVQFHFFWFQAAYLNMIRELSQQKLDSNNDITHREWHVKQF